jgi:hypothetical protein
MHDFVHRLFMTTIHLVGGGPGDGEEWDVPSLEQQPKLQEKKYGDGFFWVFLHSCNPDGTDAQIYIEGHPHDEPDFMPPNRLELWYTNQIPITDLQ